MLTPAQNVSHRVLSSLDQIIPSYERLSQEKIHAVKGALKIMRKELNSLSLTEWDFSCISGTVITQNKDLLYSFINQVKKTKLRRVAEALIAKLSFEAKKRRITKDLQLDKLPREVLLRIFGYLDGLTKSSMLQVCTSWRDLILISEREWLTSDISLLDSDFAPNVAEKWALFKNIPLDYLQKQTDLYLRLQVIEPFCKLFWFLHNSGLDEHLSDAANHFCKYINHAPCQRQIRVWDLFADQFIDDCVKEPDWCRLENLVTIVKLIFESPYASKALRMRIGGYAEPKGYHEFVQGDQCNLFLQISAQLSTRDNKVEDGIIETWYPSGDKYAPTYPPTRAGFLIPASDFAIEQMSFNRDHKFQSGEMVVICQSNRTTRCHPPFIYGVVDEQIGAIDDVPIYKVYVIYSSKRKKWCVEDTFVASAIGKLPREPALLRDFQNVSVEKE